MRFALIFLPLIPVVAGIWFIFIAGMRFQACKKHAIPYVGAGIIFILTGIILIAVDVAIIGADRINRRYANERTYEPPQSTNLPSPNIIST